MVEESISCGYDVKFGKSQSDGISEEYSSIISLINSKYNIC